LKLTVITIIQITIIMDKIIKFLGFLFTGAIYT
jgi:hypothetical protein